MSAKDMIDLERAYDWLKARYTGNGQYERPPDTTIEVYMQAGDFHEMLAAIFCDPAKIESACKARGWIRDDASRFLGNNRTLPIKAYVILPAILKPWKADGEPKRPRKRRRQSQPTTTPLTAGQTEALQLVGEHKGNVTAAALAAGKTRQAMKKLYDKALAKLGKRNADKIKTRALPVNARGQQDAAGQENDD
jgi:hypothetical protein